MQFLIVQMISLVVFNVVETRDAINYDHLQAEPEVKHEVKPAIPILKQSFEQHHEGYQFSFEAANGIQAHEIGYIKNKGDKDHETLVQQGKISYYDKDGHPITLTYIADEDGFRPQGDHLPTPPPVPQKIQEALDSQAHDQEAEHVEEEKEQRSIQYQPQSYGNTQMLHHY